MQMCTSCIRQLAISFQFRQMVIASQENIRSGLLKVDVIPSYNITLTPEDFEATTGGNHTLVINSQEFFPHQDTMIDMQDPHELSNASEPETPNPITKEESDCVEVEIHEPEELPAEQEKLLSIEKYECPNCEAVLRASTADQHTCLAKRVQGEGLGGAAHHKGRMLIQEGKLKDEFVEKTYECGGCSLTFDKKWKMHKHMLRVHGEEKK